MARIFRHTYTKSLPDCAEVFTRKGHKYARFKDAKSRMITAPISKDGQKIILETSKWYIDYRNADGASQRKAGFTDRKATEQLANDLERTAEHIRSGYKPKEHESLTVPILDHLSQFKADLLAKGTSEKQARQVHNRAKCVIEGCQFYLWSDILATKVQAFLAHLRRDTEDRRSLSAQTSNWYLQAIKAFCSWLVKEGRAPSNPLEHLARLNVKADRRHDCRALTAEECNSLLSATQQGPTRLGMAAIDRVMLYRTALESGVSGPES